MHSRLPRVRLDVRELSQATGVVRDFAYTAEKLNLSRRIIFLLTQRRLPLEVYLHWLMEGQP